MKDGKAAAYYDNTIESFTMKLGAQRIYMMNYDRRADRFTSSAYSGDRIQLGGFGCGDLQSMQDKRRLHVPLWQTGRSGFMIQERKEHTKVFAFRKERENDTRVNYDTYGIEFWM